MVVELAWSHAPTLEDYFRNRQNQPDQDFGDEGTDYYSLISDIADGLSVLHHCEVLHSDLKPSNILLFPDTEKGGLVAKIGDFGFADVDRVLTHSSSSGGPVVGVGRGQTREWAAPEMLQTCPIEIRRLASTVPVAGDVYSFGLLMAYIVLGGRSPRQLVQSGSSVAEQDGALDRLKIDDLLEGRIEEEVKLQWENGLGQHDEKAGTVLGLIGDIVKVDPTARLASLSHVRLKIMG